jgi:copper chaperone CopZ
MKYEFKVNQMSENFHKKKVEELLLAIEGVEAVEVNLGSGEVQAECSEEIGLDVFAATVEEAGYKFVWETEGK